MSEARHLTVELYPGSEPIAGRLSLNGGPASPFMGYLQLIARLEELRSVTDATGAESAAAGLPAQAPTDDVSERVQPR